jgi:restriction system protein
MALWLVRSGRRGEGESYALTSSVVGIGFAESGDLSKTCSLDAIPQRIQERRPDAKLSTVTNRAGQVRRLRCSSAQSVRTIV